MNPEDIDWLAIFPRRDFRHPMALRPGDPARYFAASPDLAAVLAERSRWLEHSPGDYVQFDPTQKPVLNEAIAALSLWTGSRPAARDSLSQQLCECGRTWKFDWVLLAPVSSHLLGGVVCFPSGWALSEKLGKPLPQIHAPVPLLNDALESRITSFLATLHPGEMWERANWGFSADSELNHHPALCRKKLGAAAALNDAWVRLERQLLHRLPNSGTVLFTIRVSVHRLAELVRVPNLAPRITHALRTMPGSIAEYKGVSAARHALIEQLERAGETATPTPQ